MRFTKEEDFKATSDALKEWKSDIQVENKSDRKGQLIKPCAARTVYIRFQTCYIN